jgi:aspartate dehydrogenase
MTTLGLIGYGAIAREIVSAFPPDAVDWVVLLREGASPELPTNVRAVTRLDLLIDARPEAVVEAAGQEAVAACVPALL